MSPDTPDTPETPDPLDPAATDAPPRRGRGRPRRDPATPPRDPGVIGGRQAETFSRAILNSLSSHLAVIEQDGRIVAVNKAWERFVQEVAADLPKAPGLGDNYLDAIQDGTTFERQRAAEVLVGLQEVIDRSRARFEIEYTLDVAGATRWFELSATPLLGAAGGAVVAHSDVSELHRSEASNAEKHRLLEAVLESSADGIVVADATGKFTLFNRAAREIAGVGIVESDPAKWTENYGIFKPDRITPFTLEELPLFRAMGGDSTDRVLMYLRNEVVPEGRFIRISGRPWVLAEGELRGGVVVFSDITDDFLAAEESRLQIQVLDAVPLAILALDAEGVVVYWNQAAERLLGWSAAELVGRRSRDVLVDDADREQVDGIRAYLLAGKQFRGEFRVRRPDGSHMRILASASARHRTDGELDGFVVVGYDVSESMRAQDAMGERQGEVQQFQKMEAIGRLAGGLAHDFNNLLTVIRGNADILLARIPAGDPLRRDVEQVTKAVDRAGQLTAQLLAFGKQRPMEPVLLSLNGVVSDFMPLIRRTLDEDVRIHVALDPDTGRMRADASQLGQVLLNLVINARDAMTEGGTLSITTRNTEIDTTSPGSPGPLAPGPYVQLSVSDTGIGMDQRIRARVFEPFFSTKPPGRGTGLGLSTAYGIVRQLGGHIWVYSEPGRGTTFKIYLPREFETAAPPVAPLPAEVPPPPVAATILLVEDEEAVRSIERRLLEIAGHVVLEAPHGEAAVAILRDHRGRIDLVITDVLMPGMTGREVVESTRRMRPGTAVLYVSGHTGEVLARVGGEADAPILQKPFSAKELHAAVRSALEATGGSRS